MSATVLKPIKLIIDNYPEEQIEWLPMENNPEDENKVNEKSQKLEEKEYIVNTNHSEMEEKASVNPAISNIKKNTTMNDLKFNNAIKGNQINKSNNNNNK
jgi:glutaminyl-tRNA synthetase